MGRPEAPITTDNKSLGELAEWLREQRSRVGQPSYRNLAVRAGCHATTLQRAAAGKTVPPLPAVLAYARSCDASPEEAKLLWKRARYEQTRAARDGRSLAAPRPGLVRDFADLSAVLQDLYEKAGSPPLRIMEKRAGEFGALPRSTAHRIINKQAVPHSLSQFRAFLRACEVPQAEQPAWEAAWSRAWRHEKQESDAYEGEGTPWSMRFPAREVSVEMRRGRQVVHRSVQPFNAEDRFAAMLIAERSETYQPHPRSWTVRTRGEERHTTAAENAVAGQGLRSGRGRRSTPSNRSRGEQRPLFTIGPTTEGCP